MIRVDFAETLEEQLETIQEFMLAQDVGSAAGRTEQLWARFTGSVLSLRSIRN
jgi:hypothetical protein